MKSSASARTVSDVVLDTSAIAAIFFRDLGYAEIEARQSAHSRPTQNSGKFANIPGRTSVNKRPCRSSHPSDDGFLPHLLAIFGDRACR